MYRELSPFHHLASRHERALRTVLAYTRERQTAMPAAELRYAAGVTNEDIDEMRRGDLLRQPEGDTWVLGLVGLVHLADEDPEIAADLAALDRLLAFGAKAYRPPYASFDEAALQREVQIDPATFARVGYLIERLGGYQRLSAREKDVLRIHEDARRHASLRDAIPHQFNGPFRPASAAEPALKPGVIDLRMRALDVDRFRVLRSARIELPSQLTVFVGPNASGKSTVLDAFAFVSMATREGLDAAIDAEHGFDRLRTLGTDDPLQLVVRFDADLGGPARTSGEYGFSLDEQGDVVVVEREWVETRADAKPLMWLDGRKATLTTLASDAKPEPLAYKSATSLALSQVWDPARHWLLAAVKAELTPAILVDRDPIIVPWGGFDERRVPSRRQHASNILKIISSAAHSAASLAVFEETLKELVPRVKGIHPVDETDRRPSIMVEERDVAQPLFVDELSAGTRQMVVLAAIYTISRYARRIVLLEEPDAGLHPDALPKLRDLLRDLSTRCTVIATTHAPSFVSTLDADREVVALSRDASGVRAQPLGDALRSKKWLQAFGTTGDAFVRNALERRP